MEMGSDRQRGLLLHHSPGRDEGETRTQLEVTLGLHFFGKVFLRRIKNQKHWMHNLKSMLTLK